jgi:hypothetical protein
MSRRSSSFRSSTSALRVAQRIFTEGATHPTDQYLRREDLAEDVGDQLPDGPLTLLELRDLLLRPATTPATRDMVWRVLIARARADRSTWLVAAIGMAMPGLRREVRSLSLTYRGDIQDLESAMAEGFVRALDRVDLGDSALCARLVRAARKAGALHVHQEVNASRGCTSEFESHEPQPPWGHPDFGLVDAVREGVLTQQEAVLIAVTRLEGRPIDDVARFLGERTNTVVVRRKRAEKRLTQAVLEGRVSCDPDLLRAATRPRADKGRQQIVRAAAAVPVSPACEPSAVSRPSRVCEPVVACEPVGCEPAGVCEPVVCEPVLAGVIARAGHFGLTRGPLPGTESPAEAG